MNVQHKQQTLLAGEDNVIVCYGATGVYTITNRDSSVYTTVNANCAFTKVEYGNGVFVGISSTKAPTAGGIVFSRDGITWVYVNANSFFGSNPGTNDKTNIQHMLALMI